MKNIKRLLTLLIISTLLSACMSQKKENVNNNNGYWSVRQSEGNSIYLSAEINEYEDKIITKTFALMDISFYSEFGKSETVIHLSINKKIKNKTIPGEGNINASIELENGEVIKNLEITLNEVDEDVQNINIVLNADQTNKLINNMLEKKKATMYLSGSMGETFINFNDDRNSLENALNKYAKEVRANQ